MAIAVSTFVATTMFTFTTIPNTEAVKVQLQQCLQELLWQQTAANCSNCYEDHIVVPIYAVYM